MARDPADIAAMLRELARLDLVKLGQQAVLERIVQAAATCCGSTGGVGLLLLNCDQQLRYVAAAGRPRRSWRVRSCDSARALREVVRPAIAGHAHGSRPSSVSGGRTWMLW